MGCLGDCWDVGPPPDSILSLPPPPVPMFFQQSLPDVVLNTTPCSSIQLCDSLPSVNRIAENGDFIEMPRKDVESWSVSSIDDTWLLVLVASSIGVLLLGALLAMFLLKCREMHLFDGNDCSIHHSRERHIKTLNRRDCGSVAPTMNGNGKLMPPAETILFQGSPNLQADNRMVWAALTPHGTQHFISDTRPPNLIDYCENDDHYETVDNIYTAATMSPQLHSGYTKDYDYEEPAPLLGGYHMNTLERDDFLQRSAVLGNADMRCASLGFSGNTFRRGVSIRPRVSSPTRIEHPNMPPLNLYPHNSTLMKKNSMNFRNIENIGTLTLPKYGC